MKAEVISPWVGSGTAAGSADPYRPLFASAYPGLSWAARYRRDQPLSVDCTPTECQLIAKDPAFDTTPAAEPAPATS